MIEPDPERGSGPPVRRPDEREPGAHESPESPEAGGWERVEAPHAPEPANDQHVEPDPLPEAGSRERVEAPHALEHANDQLVQPEPSSDTEGHEPPQPPRDEVFWGYSELFLFVGLAIPAMLAGYGLIRAILGLFRLHPIRAAEVLAEQLVTYIFLFLVLVVIFRAQYGRPFWASLGWQPMRIAPILAAGAGWVAAFGVVAIAYAMHTPNTPNALTELMQDRLSLILVTVFGVTLGPLAEELVFRGFLQPLLAKSFGVAAGIVLAALPFGLLHFSEYGNSWRHVVLISAAGAAFGWMRHASGSTKASTLMHSAYNALFFTALWATRQQA